MPDAAFWNTIAEKYSQQPVELPEAFEKKIATTRSLMSPADTLLEIGCGTGSLALRLADAAAHIHALDISSEMIRIANEKKAAQGVDNLTFHLGAFDDSAPFAPASMDGLCAYSILHLVDDLDATLARLYSVLKPGGFLVSSTVCLGESWVPFGPILSVMRLFGKAPGGVMSLSKQALSDALQRAGFTDLTQPDVGANSTTAFVVARKPA